MKKHEYLEADNHYEVGSVKKGRTDKTCEHCGKSIPIGMPHDTHKFYDDNGDYPTYPTHKECSQPFEESLLTREDIDREVYEGTMEYKLEQSRLIINS